MWGKVFTVHRLGCFVVDLGQVRRACSGEDRRQDIDDMTGLMRLQRAFDPVGPMRDQRGGDAALMHPVFE